jgi:hypothetical protein
MMLRGMTRRQAEEALEVDVRDLKVNIRQNLAQESLPTAFSEKTEPVSIKRRVAPATKNLKPGASG